MTATANPVVKSQVVQVKIEHKWKNAYVIVDYFDCFVAHGFKGVEKKYMFNDENKTWRKLN